MKQILLFLLLLIPTFGFNQGRIINLDKEHYLSYLLTSTGDGTGVSTLTVAVSKNTIFTFVDGTARFYSDASGTLDESTTWMATTGAAKTRYIKCITGTSNMTISGNTITSWSAWTSGVNAASLGGDISKLTALTYIKAVGNNTLLGSVAGLSLTGLEVEGSNILSGSIAGLTSLTAVAIKGSNTITGSFNNLTSLTYFYIAGNNTVFGNPALISAGITCFRVIGNNQVVDYTSVGDWSSISADGIIQVIPDVGYGLDEDEVDLFIIEIESTRTASRAIHVTLTGSNAARTAASDAAVAAIIADGGSVTTN